MNACNHSYATRLHLSPPPSLPPQVRPHDAIRFQEVTLEESYIAAHRTDALVAAVRSLARGKVQAPAAGAGLESFAVAVPAMPATRAVLVEVAPSEGHPGYLIRLAGDRYVQIEYGPMELDLTLRWGYCVLGGGGLLGPCLFQGCCWAAGGPCSCMQVGAHNQQALLLARTDWRSHRTRCPIHPQGAHPRAGEAACIHGGCRPG